MERSGNEVFASINAALAWMRWMLAAANLALNLAVFVRLFIH